MEEPQSKRNDPHVQRLKIIVSTIQGLKDIADAKELTEEHLKKFREQITQQIVNIKGSYNNREMSLVVTKLQEAGHWVSVDNPSKSEFKNASDRLTEAKNWASEYIKVLQ